VVFFAQEEAGILGGNYVSTEHLLLGVTRESDTIAARVLACLSVPLEDIRSEIERQVAQGDGRLGQDMQLTPRAKRVIDLAYDEARQLNNNYIGTEHLLLGLIREGEGLAGRVLSKLGVDLERTRREVMLLQDAEPRAAEDRRTVAANLMGQAEGHIRRAKEALLSKRSTQESSSPNAPNPGDLGAARSVDGRSAIEVAMDAATFVELDAVFGAKDAHGYRALAQGNQTMFLVPNGTPLKLLYPPAGGVEAVALDGCYVRVLAGEYEGYAGWIFGETFQRKGPDEASFPPEL
jgi:hypothetical protein